MLPDLAWGEFAIGTVPSMGPVDGGEDGAGAEPFVEVLEEVFFDSVPDDGTEDVFVVVLEGGVLGTSRLGEVAPFPEEDGGGVLVAGDDDEVGHDHFGELLGGVQVGSSDGADGFKEFAGTTVGDFPEEFFFGTDVAVEASGLDAEGVCEVADAGGEVTFFVEEAFCCFNDLLFAIADGFHSVTYGCFRTFVRLN